MSLIHRASLVGNWVQEHLFPYDALTYARSNNVNARRCALLLAAIYLLFGASLIFSGFIDNKPTTASTGLATAHRMVTLDPAGWFSDGIWWRGKPTPTPLPYTVHGIFFGMFGYSVRDILLLHTLVGTLAAWLLGRITARRFGAWTGLLAMVLYLTAPLSLYVNFSGWTFAWATMFLLLTIDLLDRAVLARRIPLYLLGGITLGCAGMSRPENYAVALLVVLFIEIPIRYRVAFLCMALAYPVAQYVHNNVYLGDHPGLRILDDARTKMTYAALLWEWFKSVQHQILNRNFAPFIQYGLLPAVLFFGLPRRRFLSCAWLYFCFAFFAAYAMRRISFNHEGYYYAHVTLAMPFLAAALTWGASIVTRAARFIRVPARQSAWIGALFVLAVLVTQGMVLRHAYAERLFFRVPEPVREVRDFLATRLEDHDRVALDYFAEVSWMLAEIECADGRDAWYYSTNMFPEPRPSLNPARKDLSDQECAVMNAWVARNFRAWATERPPHYLVTLTEAAWEAERTRKGATGHYRMFSLRPALGVASLEQISLGGESGTSLVGRVVFENDGFLVYEVLEMLPGFGSGWYIWKHFGKGLTQELRNGM